MNKYKVLSVVGEGAYGTVLKCANQATGEIVAIKKFKDRQEDDEHIWRNTMRELKALKRLHHPNIVVMLEAFRRRGRLVMVMEFVDQNMLQLLESLPRKELLHPKRVLDYTYQVLSAVQYLHEQGLIHRDIKPENLLVANDNTLKLCDFGFIRGMDKPDEFTEYIATRWYRAPELVLREPYGQQVDLWAIGCIIGELADKTPLFPGSSDIDQLYRIQVILGSLPPALRDRLRSKPRFRDVEFAAIKKPIGLKRRYSKVLDAATIDLIRVLLNYDPAWRPSAKNCLSHPAFKHIQRRSDTATYTGVEPSQATSARSGRRRSTAPSIASSEDAPMPPVEESTPADAPGRQHVPRLVIPKPSTLDRQVDGGYGATNGSPLRRKSHDTMPQLVSSRKSSVDSDAPLLRDQRLDQRCTILEDPEAQHARFATQQSAAGHGKRLVRSLSDTPINVSVLDAATKTGTSQSYGADGGLQHQLQQLAAPAQAASMRQQPARLQHAALRSLQGREATDTDSAGMSGSMPPAFVQSFRKHLRTPRASSVEFGTSPLVASGGPGTPVQHLSSTPPPPPLISGVRTAWNDIRTGHHADFRASHVEFESTQSHQQQQQQQPQQQQVSHHRHAPAQHHPHKQLLFHAARPRQLPARPRHLPATPDTPVRAVNLRASLAELPPSSQACVHGPEHVGRDKMATSAAVATGRSARSSRRSASLTALTGYQQDKATAPAHVAKSKDKRRSRKHKQKQNRKHSKE